MLYTPGPELVCSRGVVPSCASGLELLCSRSGVSTGPELLCSQSDDRLPVPGPELLCSRGANFLSLTPCCAYTDAVREAAWNEYSRMLPLPDVEACLSAQLHALFYKVVVTIDSSQDFM